MEAFFRFLAAYEILIYLVLGISLVITIRWLWKAVLETREAIFGLEHQIAMRHLTSAIGSVLLIFMLATSELVITSFIVPDLPASTFLQTPTVNLLPVAQSTPGRDSSTAAAGVEGSNSGSNSSGCTPDKLNITAPTPGQTINGIVNIFGTVLVEDLGFYKFEFSPVGADSWATFFAGKSIEPDKPLGIWDTSQLLPGDYQLRLVATDNQGAEFPPCIITVHVTGSP